MTGSHLLFQAGVCAIAISLFYVLLPRVWPELTLFDPKVRNGAWLKASRWTGRGWAEGALGAIVGLSVWSGWWLEDALEVSLYQDYWHPVEIVVGIVIVVPLFRRRRIALSLRRMLIERGEFICLQCGYNLTGNVTGSCSECGVGLNK